MKTLRDMVESRNGLSAEAVSKIELTQKGFKKRARLLVPLENPLFLPTDPRGLIAVDDVPEQFLGLDELTCRAARRRLLAEPGIVLPLTRPTEVQLVALGLNPAGFRMENPRRFSAGIALELPDQPTIYGTCEFIAVEHGLSIGNTVIIEWREKWSYSLAEAEEQLLWTLADASDSVRAGPEPGARPWRTVVALLGGAEKAGSLPTNWKRHLRLAAGLHMVNLDIRTNPEGARIEIVGDLKSSPPDGLLVWADWVRNPDVFISVYRSARPTGTADILGSTHGDQTFDETSLELLMHLRNIAPIDRHRERIIAPLTWQDAEVAILNLQGAHFALTDRAQRLLVGNPYPKPQRMFEHVEKLAKVALAYHQTGGELGSALATFAMEHHGIEIALFHNASRLPQIDFDGSQLDPTPHVKVDDHKHPDQCGRIYFAIDRSSFRFVVDHIGLHDY